MDAIRIIALFILPLVVVALLYWPARRLSEWLKKREKMQTLIFDMAQRNNQLTAALNDAIRFKQEAMRWRFVRDQKSAIGVVRLSTKRHITGKALDEAIDKLMQEKKQ